MTNINATNIVKHKRHKAVLPKVNLPNKNVQIFILFRPTQVVTQPKGMLLTHFDLVFKVYVEENQINQSTVLNVDKGRPYYFR